jgi:hypothetical protein
VEAYSMSDEEEEQPIKKEDEHGNILVYPAWSRRMRQRIGRISGKFRSISECLGSITGQSA